jgi:hypothetical protein
MRRLIRYVTLCVAFTSTNSVTATPSDIEQWTNINAHIALERSETLRFYLEIQPRQGDDAQRLGTVQHQAALVISPSESLSLYAGYGWTPYFLNSEYHRDYRDEQRLWQSVNYRRDLAGSHWLLRLRQEQRMIMRTDGTSNRSRLLLKGSYPLLADENFGLTWSDEVMYTLNATTGGPVSGYDRNRIFFGPYWRIERTRYEVGYLGEHQKRFGDDERWAHVLAISVSCNF